MLKLGGSRGVREERTDHAKLFPRSFTGSGLTEHQKVHVSTFDGKPPHPTPAFPFNVMAFPFNGRSHLMGVPI